MPPGQLEIFDRFVVLACGGRGFADRDFVFATLDELHAARPITLLVHGAATGADTHAGAWAHARGVAVAPYPATWRVSPGASVDLLAGSKRNRRMLRRERPDLVVAFPGGSGTGHMVRIARAARVECWTPRYPGAA